MTCKSLTLDDLERL